MNIPITVTQQSPPCQVLSRFDFEKFLLTRGFRPAPGKLARMTHSGGYTAIYLRGELAVAVTIVTDRTYPMPGPRQTFQLYPGSEAVGYFESGFFDRSPRWEFQKIPRTKLDADTFLNKASRLVRSEALRNETVALCVDDSRNLFGAAAQ